MVSYMWFISITSFSWSFLHVEMSGCVTYIFLCFLMKSTVVFTLAQLLVWVALEYNGGIVGWCWGGGGGWWRGWARYTALYTWFLEVLFISVYSISFFLCTNMLFFINFILSLFRQYSTYMTLTKMVQYQWKSLMQLLLIFLLLIHLEFLMLIGKILFFRPVTIKFS